MLSEKLSPNPETDAGPRSSFLSKSTIKPGHWYRLRPGLQQETALGALAKALVGFVIGGLVYAWGVWRLAVVIWVVSGIIGIVTLSSQKGRTGVGRFFAAIGRTLGRILGTLLLTPIYLFGFTIARVVNRLAGRDPLCLRDTASQTFWQPADQDRRTVRHIRSLYATEVRAPSGRMGVIVTLSLLGLFVVGEIVARSLGFGHPIMYQADPLIGWYPAGNQYSHRFGGLISLNSRGMRAPEYALEKPPGTLRIFMIGDSTLWGGSYVDQSDIYARLLDIHLDNNPSANDVEVWNIGTNGWGPFHEIAYVNKFGAYNADVAVVCMPFGDIYREPTKFESTASFEPTKPPNFALEEILRHLLWRSRTMLMGPPPDDRTAENATIGIGKYVELTKMLQAKGCEVLFAILPSRDAGMSTTTPETEQKEVARIRAAPAPLGVPVDFPAGLFHGKGSENEIYHDVCHINGPGHHIYADHLKAWLEQNSAKIRAHRESAGVAPAASKGETK